MRNHGSVNYINVVSGLKNIRPQGRKVKSIVEHQSFKNRQDVSLTLAELESLLRMREADLESYSSITLQDARADYLPPEMFKLSKLESLTIAKTNLSYLPKHLERNVSLQSLFLIGNDKLTEFQLQFSKLAGLVQFVIEGAAIEELPEVSRSLPNLNLLVARSCPKLKKLPEELDLGETTEINVEGGQICSLDFSNWRTPRLCRVNLSCNRLEIVPESIASLKESLGVLKISSNPLMHIADELSSCVHLRNIELKDCRLTRIPVCLWNLPQLFNLDIRGNFIPEDEIKKFKSHRSKFFSSGNMTVTHD